MSEPSHTNHVYRAIEAHLNSSQIRENLTPLFCETLLWGQTTAAPFTREVTVRRGEKATIPFVPVTQLSGLPVFRVDWPYEKPPTVTQRRAVYRALTATYIEHLLVYVTADAQQATFVWARQRGGATSRGKVEMRALPYTVGAAARTTIERLGELAFTLEELGLFGEPPLTAVTDKLNAAFDVEAVTQAFFVHYQRVFKELRQILNEASQDVPADVGAPTDVGVRWTHDYALQTLNRLMFLYFVQRKGWLGGDPAFIATFWQAYKTSTHPPDTFFTDWLFVLFFEAFNNRFQAGRADYQQRFPPAIHEALAMAPYLNGGLFTRNDLDRAHEVALPDAVFTTLFDRFEGRAPGFLERYNFTITESTPFDIEVAVDPEMIGKVYESLVNVSEEADERGEAGIFYTPRVEIDLMCRLTLVDWFAHHLGREHKAPLYTAVFALEEEDKAHADDALMQHNLWSQLSDLLDTVTVVDPACGSGSFLVGMLQVLDDLVARADAQLGRERTPYERRKRISGHSLYGVDVMDWAVHVAELRLWLQLVIETELAQAELKFRPLLPNLSFKVRPGDSLVQEVGGINLALRQGSRLIPPQVKGRITRLKGEKLKFYNNDPHCAYTSAAQLRQAEVALFRDILDARTQAIDQRLKAIDDALRPQVNLFGEEQTTQMALDRVGLGREREQLTRDREQVTRAREALRLSSRDFQIAPQATVPFVWDIAFVEVFEGEHAGFDIVIGNPPYVRQEAIHDPRPPPDEVTRASKRAYKSKLARAVYTAWPRTFGYDFVKDKPTWKLAARSDLYIYFYLHALSLLNDRGAFCFITSNAWLDVGYGKDLQQFLLTRGQVKLVLDNQVHRSFTSADVNTVIVLLGPAQDAKTARQASLRHTARFVMLSVPFEDVLTPAIWEKVERVTTRHTTPDYRVFPITQADLLENGMDERQRFSGDKWGGKYLRAPDIYWIIMEKTQDKLVRLGDIADVRRGFTTGANAFFYLDEEAIAQWGIEEEFLAPAIKSSRECNHIWLEKIDQVSDLSLFVCHKTHEALESTNALEYIKAGEAKKYHKRPSCRGRSPWWDLGEREGAKVNCNYLIGKVMRFFASDRPFFVSDNFQEVHSEIDAARLSAACNSTIAQLNINVIGRSNFGDGLLKVQTYEVSDIVIPDPRLLPLSEVRQVIVNAQTLDLINTDRRALDAIIFDVLGLTQGERDAVYEALITMVEARLHKAQSLR